jgi:DNA-binding CsgD family transcriptional regulator/PAS domain-containing protein
MGLADEDAQTIQLAYQAALDATLWPKLLQQLLDMFGGHCGSFICRPPNGTGGDCIEIGFDPKALEQFFGYYAGRNVLLARGRERPAGAIVSDQDLLPKDEFRRTEYYNDLLLAQENTNAILTAFLWRDPERFVVFNCNRAPNRPEYDVADKARLRPLVPHLARAIDVALRLDSFGAGPLDQFSLLENTMHGILVLSETGHVLYANATGERLLSMGDGLQAGHDGLCASTPALTTALRATIARAAAGGSETALTLARRSGGQPIVAVAMPLATETNWLRPERRRVLLLLRDLAERPALDAARLQSMFRLTAAEARLALRLHQGNDLGATATALGISPHTARTHLKSILRKTDTHRQAELLHCLNGIADLTSRLPG